MEKNGLTLVFTGEQLPVRQDSVAFAQRGADSKPPTAI